LSTHHPARLLRHQAFSVKTPVYTTDAELARAQEGAQGPLAGVVGDPKAGGMDLHVDLSQIIVAAGLMHRAARRAIA
jgi:hypothetical protein